ncbi:glucose 1-dehydrogenase [Streptomyces sp. NPDC007205]|uniref:glucose 1-dehydrogenase n=1 Tax=Streptomyces sp. NPDC007205 TaxID=3154316 RepID=UPI0033CAC62F
MSQAVADGRSLTGQVVLVTGGARGIGQACVMALSRAGATVVIADIDGASAAKTAQMIQDSGGTALDLECDVTQPEHTAELITMVVDAYGRLDCAVNNAGINEPGQIVADVSPKVWDRIWAVNVKGVWLCMQAELRQMLAQGSGVIVNMASTLSLVASREATAYVASKHAVLGLTRATAVDYARQGIRVNAVCPGPVPTDMMHRVLRGDAKAVEELRATAPTGRFTTPEEVAAAVVWLCSPAASHILGHGLVVDGGWTAV